MGERFRDPVERVCIHLTIIAALVAAIAVIELVGLFQ